MQTLIKKFLTLLVISMLLLGLAQAEENLGSMPSRGVVLPLTQADMDAGLSMMTDMTSTGDGLDVPVFFLCYMTPESGEAMAAALEAYGQGDGEKTQAAMEHYYNQVYITDVLYLFKADYDYTKLPNLVTQTTNLGENDGYVYLREVRTPAPNVPEHQQGLDAALARSRELMAGITFQPIVFEPGEMTQMSNAFPAFTTQDLHGNTVTNEIFHGKTLTVVNIWGTYCTPCVDEMPDLAAWSASMPEGVQLIGLVCDLYSPEQTEVLETAKMICEATGATYTSLIANEHFAGLLGGVAGVPTTVFVDGTGTIVGQPIVGANVPACKAFVEEYLNAQ